MKKHLLAAVAVVVSGCANMAWYKSGSTQESFNMESAACELEAYRSARTPMDGGALFDACMRSKGWVLRQRR